MTSSPPSVLVLGASGRFGQAAVEAFADAGWQVTAQRRAARSRAPFASQRGRWRWLDADVADTARLAAQVGHADVLVHAMNPPYTVAAWRDEAPGLMRAAIDTSAALGALLMFPGNVYNFGAGMPQLLREDTPQLPSSAKGVVRAALERQLADAWTKQGVTSVVIRAGDFFGKGRGSLFDQVIVKDIAGGRVGWPGAVNVATPWAYLPDLARAFVQVAERRQALHGAEVLHFAGHHLRLQNWIDALSPLAHRHGWLAAGPELKVQGLPWRLLRLGGLLLPTWASIAEMRYLWHTPHALDNRRLQALIGTEPRTPLPAAVTQACSDLGLTAAGSSALRPASGVGR